MLKRKKDGMAVEEFCNKVRNKLGKTVKEIKLFGSKATDKDIPGSDIDLFIVVSKKTPEIEDIILDIAFEIDLKYNVYISPRIVSQTALKDPLWKNTPFIKNVEREGVPV
ncbi:MAG: nucleotidyltransferase domain-containing protein [Nitrospirota bacterium]